MEPRVHVNIDGKTSIIIIGVDDIYVDEDGTLKLHDEKRLVGAFKPNRWEYAFLEDNLTHGEINIEEEKTQEVSLRDQDDTQYIPRIH